MLAVSCSTAKPERCISSLPRPEYALAWSPQFQGAVTSFRELVRLLDVIPAEESDEALATAIGALATAIEVVPDPQGVAVAIGARLIREALRATSGHAASAVAPSQVQAVHRALDMAGGLLLLLARGPYVRNPSVLQKVDAFREAMNQIDPGGAMTAQHAGILRALTSAGDVLTAMESASGIPQPSGA